MLKEAPASCIYSQIAYVTYISRMLKHSLSKWGIRSHNKTGQYNHRIFLINWNHAQYKAVVVKMPIVQITGHYSYNYGSILSPIIFTYINDLPSSKWQGIWIFTDECAIWPHWECHLVGMAKLHQSTCLCARLI